MLLLLLCSWPASRLRLAADSLCDLPALRCAAQMHVALDNSVYYNDVILAYSECGGTQNKKIALLSFSARP